MKKVICALVLILAASASADLERRAAIDIGSGGTKVAIAVVDTDSQSIQEVLFETSFPVPYQASLDKSNDGTFDEETMALGLKTFKDIRGIAAQYEVTKIAAIATSAFRKATNSQAYVDFVQQETQIPIQVISQSQEGEIAFFSAMATGEYAADEVIVWDIGTGSLQITTQNETGELTVYKGEEMGSVAFKSYIMEELQNKPLSEATPNPMSDDDFYFASKYARAFARKASPIIKKKINNQMPVLGIGRLFNNSVGPIGMDEGTITRNGLRHYIIRALNKSDAEIDNPFAHVDVSNCILTLALMKALHIHEIQPVDTTSTKGMLVHPSFYE